MLCVVYRFLLYRGPLRVQDNVSEWDGFEKQGQYSTTTRAYNITPYAGGLIFH